MRMQSKLLYINCLFPKGGLLRYVVRLKQNQVNAHPLSDHCSWAICSLDYNPLVYSTGQVPQTLAHLSHNLFGLYGPTIKVQHNP